MNKKNYVCVHCRIAARGEQASGKVRGRRCPQCHQAMLELGDRWRIPNKKDVKQWAKLGQIAHRIVSQSKVRVLRNRTKQGSAGDGRLLILGETFEAGTSRHVNALMRALERHYLVRVTIKSSRPISRAACESIFQRLEDAVRPRGLREQTLNAEVYGENVLMLPRIVTRSELLDRLSTDEDRTAVFFRNSPLKTQTSYNGIRMHIVPLMVTEVLRAAFDAKFGGFDIWRVDSSLFARVRAVLPRQWAGPEDAMATGHYDPRMQVYLDERFHNYYLLSLSLRDVPRLQEHSSGYMRHSDMAIYDEKMDLVILKHHESSLLEPFSK